MEDGLKMVRMEAVFQWREECVLPSMDKTYALLFSILEPSLQQAIELVKGFRMS